MLLKCTADGRRIKVNGVPVSQGNVARGMKMTMSTTPTMSSRVHRTVMRAPHKRTHIGKIAHPGKMSHHPGKMAHHPGKGKMAHAGKLTHHPGKLAHLGKFGKMAHYTQNAHSLRPPEPCDNSNDSGLGPDHDQRHAINRSDATDEWDHNASLAKRRRCESETAVKIECDDANDAYAFPTPPPAPAPSAPPVDALTLAPHHAATTVFTPVAVPASGEPSISSPSIAEAPGQRFQDESYRSCGKLGGKYVGGGKLSGGGKLTGKLGGKFSGKYGGKLAQALARRRAFAAMHTGPPGLSAPLLNKSRDGLVELQILCQPESQHRARYQTEGSRGAVKDNSGNGFPIVKLVGYDKPAVLQVFIGTDTGRVAPHMFYQACRVSGKNSTPCKERKEDGTVVIEIDLDPTKNWQVTCDCVGILKERNVDVEHRFGESLGGSGGAAEVTPHPAPAPVSRGKKKSTRCRMVFRTEIVNAAGHTETLQVCSTQIICTQPPGVPEVCRKSLVSCPATGGLELYLLGKNFLKESRVVFSQRQDGRTTWEEEVVPDKEFLQQTHLVCCVPAYARTEITEAVQVQVFVRSGGKASEPHTFYYTPPALDTGPQHCTRHHAPGVPGEEARPVLMWGGSAMMPPPALPVRRPSLILPDPHSPLGLKSELADDTSQHSLVDHSDESVERTDDLTGVDLRLKSESMVAAYDAIKLSPPQVASEPPSPLATFTQQLQAIQNQVQTDKMVESVTAAIFNSDDNAGQMYGDQQMLPMQPLDPMQRLISQKNAMNSMDSEMKVLDRDLMPPGAYDPYSAITKVQIQNQHRERQIVQQAQMEALVEDAMKATAAILPADAAKLDELVNARVDDHMSGAAAAPATDVLLSPGTANAATPPVTLPPMPPSAISPEVILNPQVSPSLLCDGGQRIALQPPAPQDELMMLPEIPTSVKTPPAAVKSMILSAAAEILTSDTTMNALVTSAINTANILSTETPAEPTEPAAMSQAVSQAVRQAVSQAVSHAVSQAVSQEMTAPAPGLTDMSDSDLLSYINTSTFDQV